MQIKSVSIQNFGILKKVNLSIPSKGIISVSGQNGCLSGETYIDTVPRDINKNPKGIKIKDLVGKNPIVSCYDESIKKLVLSSARDVRKTGTLQTYRVIIFDIRTNNTSELVGTYEHPVMLRNGEYQELGLLKCGDLLMPKHIVLFIEKHEVIDVYDMEVPGYGNFVANGVVVHNSGKSTLLAAMSAATFYRKIPYYDTSVKDLLGKDGLIELTTDNYKFTIDNTGSEIKYLLETPSKVLGGPGAKSYDEAVSKILPDFEIFMATHFSSQSDALGLINKDSGDRSKFFRSLIGVDIYENILKATQKNSPKESVPEIDFYKDDILRKKQEIETAKIELDWITGLFKTEITSLLEQQKKLQKLEADIAKRKDVNVSISEESLLEQAAREVCNYMLCKSLRPLLSELTAIQNRLVKLRSELSNKSYKLILLQNNIEQQSDELEIFQVSTAKINPYRDPCRVCPLAEDSKAIIDKNNLSISKLQSDSNKLKNEIKALGDEIIEAETLELRVRSRANEIGDLSTDVSSRLYKLEKDHQRYRDIFGSDSRTLEELLIAKEEILKDPNVLKAQELEAKFSTEIYELKSSIRMNEEFIEKATKQLEYYVNLKRTSDVYADVLKCTKDAMNDAIRSAIPGINSVASGLCENILGGRFSISIEEIITGGKSGFAVRINDGYTSESRKKPSWGEGALLSEVLSLSIAIATDVEKGGILIRDEVTGGLDAANKEDYFNLMRSLIAMNQYSQIFIVAHDKEIIDKCDAVIELANGSAHLRWQ